MAFAHDCASIDVDASRTFDALIRLNGLFVMGRIALTARLDFMMIPPEKVLLDEQKAWTVNSLYRRQLSL